MKDSILVTYATRYGSTEEVAEAIATVLDEQGFEVALRPMSDVQSLDGFDVAVLGSAVNYGKWVPAAADFVRSHQEELAGMPTVLFTVHIQNIADDEQSSRNRLAYLDEVRPYIQPVSEAYFAGRFNRHAAEELIPRWLAYIMPTFDFRKWGKIRAWANNLPALLFSRTVTIGGTDTAKIM